MGDNATGKQRGRPFRKGASGNRSGRPPDARNRTTVAIEGLLEDEGEAIGRKLVERALVGDPVALRLAMERIGPVRRGRPVRFALPAVATAGDVNAAIGGVLGVETDRARAGEARQQEETRLQGVRLELCRCRLEELADAAAAARDAYLNAQRALVAAVDAFRGVKPSAYAMALTRDPPPQINGALRPSPPGRPRPPAGASGWALCPPQASGGR